MHKLIITDPARSDLIEIRLYTIDHYGMAAANFYDALLKQALIDLGTDPHRPGAKARPEIGKNIHSYHIRFSKMRAGSHVKSPRHFILYFMSSQDEVVISRVLHDTRDFIRHIPDEHIEQAGNTDPSKG